MNSTDEKKNPTGTGATGTAGTTGATGTSGINRKDTINAIYDAQRSQAEADLKSSYDRNMSAMNDAQKKIAPQYQTASNDLATQYERNRRNFNQAAAGSGLNTGARGQAAIAQNNEYLRAFGNLRSSEAEAEAQAERQKADATAQYNSDVERAKAQNEYNRQTALLNEDNNALTRDMENAGLLAQYGDFSGYAAIYGQDRADAMASIWIAQNPDLAYNTGRIDAERYKEMTGKYPVGYNAVGTNLDAEYWKGLGSAPPAKDTWTPTTWEEAEAALLAAGYGKNTPQYSLAYRDYHE